MERLLLWGLDEIWSFGSVLFFFLMHSSSQCSQPAINRPVLNTRIVKTCRRLGSNRASPNGSQQNCGLEWTPSCSIWSQWTPGLAGNGEIHRFFLGTISENSLTTQSPSSDKNSASGATGGAISGTAPLLKEIMFLAMLLMKHFYSWEQDSLLNYQQNIARFSSCFLFFVCWRYGWSQEGLFATAAPRHSWRSAFSDYSHAEPQTPWLPRDPSTQAPKPDFAGIFFPFIPCNTFISPPFFCTRAGKGREGQMR